MFYTTLLAKDTFNYNLLTIKDNPQNAWINYIIIDDSIMTINISANNTINDSTYAGWINIDRNTYILENGVKRTMVDAKGIAIAPEQTNFSRPNQTISFNLLFPRIDNSNNSFDLIENDSSEWKFAEIKFHRPTDGIASIYLAPHVFAKHLSSFTDSLMSHGEYDYAIKINDSLFKYIKQEKINANVLTSTIAYELAGCYNKLREDTACMTYSDYVIESYKNNYWKEDVALSRMYGVQADTYARKGMYSQAIEHANEALRIKRALYPDGSSDLALTYGKLALYHEQIEEYENAISCAENALLIRENINNENPIDRIPIVTNLCRLYYIQNRFAEALELALAYKTEHTKSVNISAYINLCGVCSHSYNNLGNNTKAAACAKEGYDLITQYYPNNSTMLVNFIDILSLDTKIDIQKAYLNKSTKDETYFSIMQNLASDYDKAGKVNSAIRLQESCLNQRISLSVRNNVKECEGRNRLLYYYMKINNKNKIISLTDSCLRQTELVFGKYSYESADLHQTVFRYLYDNEDYVSAYFELNRMLDVYKFLLVQDFSLLSYDDRETLWTYMGDWFHDIFLNCYLMAIYSSPSRADELNALLYDNTLISKGLILNTQIANNAHIKLSSALKERKLNSDSISTYLKSSLYGSYKDILSQLDPNSAAIEFIQADHTREIIALCLIPRVHTPIFEFICKIEELENLRKNNATPGEYNNLVWGKLAKHLTGKKKVFVSFDGILNTLPIENYAYEDNTLIPNTNIYRVSSTRNIISKTNKATDDFLLIGGLTYNHNNDLMNFEDLPETTVEINMISELLRKGMKHFTLLTGNEGNKETVVKQLHENHSVIHFATHAFYWKEDIVEKKSIEHLLKNFKTNNRTDKKLIRSGIALSFTEKGTDRILSSYDIACLNLNSTKLIVLPNCKSGLGDITKDGVIGLQRAFKEAQAESILMSLWDADEVSTRLLMVEFYKNYLSGIGVHESLKNAQLYIKNYKDEDGNKLFEAPYYWAGFVILD